MATDYPDWGALAALQTFITNLNLASQTLQATAAEIADEIEATGIPLLGNPTGLWTTVSNLNVPAGASQQLIADDAGSDYASVSEYLSYDAWIQASCTSGSAAPFLTFFIYWYATAAASFPLWIEKWTCPFGTSLAPQVIATGPIRGAYMAIGVTNEDASNAFTINKLKVYGNSRPAPEPEPDWRNTLIASAVPGFTVPSAGANTDGVVGYFTGTLAASATASLLCGLYNGPLLISVTVSGTSPDLAVAPQCYISGTGLKSIYQVLNVGTEADSQSFTLNAPRSPVVLALTNDNASDSVTYTITAVAAPTR